MLAANLNPHVEEGRISVNSIVTLKKFTCSMVKERKILIVLDVFLEKTQSMDVKIGNPVNIEEIVAGKASTSDQSNSPASTSSVTSPAVSSIANDSNKVPAPLPGTANQHAAFPNIHQNFNGHSISNINPIFPTNSNAASIDNSPLTHTSMANNNTHPNFTGQKSEPASEYTPIASLSPYNNRWTIKARCVSKQDIRVFTNARGQGKVFSVTLLDASGEIRATAFNDVVTQFFPLFEVGRVYSITKGQVKIAKRGTTGGNPYDMSLEKDTIIKPLTGTEAVSVPTLTYSITPIMNLLNCPKDTIVDVIGIVTDVHPLSTIVAKATGKQLIRRDVTIVDDSLASIRVTLWGKQAEDAEGVEWKNEPVLAIKGAKLSDWSGKTLSVIGTTQLTLQPMDLDAALALRGWYDSVGPGSTIKNLSSGDDTMSFSSMNASPANTNFAPIAERKTFSQLREEQFLSEKAEYNDIVATITFIKFDGMVAYAACPGLSDNIPCQKKVVEVGPSLFRCEKCQRTYDTCNYRYVLSLHVADHTGQSWVNAFNDAGEQLLEMPASELMQLRDTDLAAFDRVFKKANFTTWRFRLRAKQESYQGETKMRLSIVSMTPVPYAQESNMLLDFCLAC